MRAPFRSSLRLRSLNVRTALTTDVDVYSLLQLLAIAFIERVFSVRAFQGFTLSQAFEFAFMRRGRFATCIGADLIFVFSLKNK